MNPSTTTENDQLDDRLDELAADSEAQRTRQIQAEAVRAVARRHAIVFGHALEHRLTRAWLRDQADAIATGQIGAES